MQRLGSLALLFILLGISGGAWHLWDKDTGPLITPAGRYPIALGASLLALSLVSSLVLRRGLPSKEALCDARIWSIGLIALYISDWVTRPWGLFKGGAVRGELFVGFILSYLLIKKGQAIRFFTLWPLIVVALLVWSFKIASNGSLLFSDDHAMFLFRLKLLKENFPNIPFWSPLWNAGFDARDFFATGALNFFLLFSPLIYLFNVEQVYSFIVATLLWVITPLSVFSASRLLSLSKKGSAIATTLAVCSSLFWYRWCLKYGTVGFITSTALFPLVFAISVRLLHTESPKWRTIITFALISSLMLLWSPSGLALIPVAALALTRAPTLIFSKRHVLTALLILAINLPWMAIMWRVSNLGHFLNSEQTASVAPPTPVANEGDRGNVTAPLPQPPPNNGTIYRHGRGQFNLKKALNNWHNNSNSLNPLILILAIPAIISFPGLGKRYLVSTLVWLVGLGTVGVSIKPQLELDRMVVIASILATIPIGHLIAQAILSANRGTTWRLSAATICSFLIISPFAATSIVLNRSDDTYSFMSNEAIQLRDVIANNTAGGRAFFSGCVLHELSGGHLAPLAIWTNIPMYATSYAHNIWWYTQPIPQNQLQRGDQGVRDFLDGINATLVLAHEPAWIEYLQKRPAEYQQIWRGESFFAFKRINYTSNYTLNGSLSDVKFTTNSATFTTLSEALILKFRYLPFLKASGCKVAPAPSSLGFDLISLSGCTPGASVTLTSVSPLERFFGESAS